MQLGNEKPREETKNGRTHFPKTTFSSDQDGEIPANNSALPPLHTHARTHTRTVRRAPAPEETSQQLCWSSQRPHLQPLSPPRLSPRGCSWPLASLSSFIPSSDTRPVTGTFVKIRGLTVGGNFLQCLRTRCCEARGLKARHRDAGLLQAGSRSCGITSLNPHARALPSPPLTPASFYHFGKPYDGPCNSSRQHLHRKLSGSKTSHSNIHNCGLSSCGADTAVNLY